MATINVFLSSNIELRNTIWKLNFRNTVISGIPLPHLTSNGFSRDDFVFSFDDHILFIGNLSDMNHAMFFLCMFVTEKILNMHLHENAFQ